MTDPIRTNRFSSGPEQSSVEKGYQDITKSPYDAAFLYRNLRPYKSLKRFASPAGLRKLKGMGGNYSRYERLAATAVLKDAGVKRRKLDVTMGNEGFRKPLLKRAGAKVAQGYDIRTLGQTGKSVSDIQNKRLRQATKNVITIRRNRRVMSTNIFAGRGYDIQQNHITKSRTSQKYRLGYR